MKKALFLLFLSGCMVGPNYSPPEIAVGDAWVETTAPEEVTADWWTLFDDPLLTQTIQKALENNKSLKAALANIEQAIYLRQVAASALFPQIGSDINATKTYFSKNGPIFAIGPSTGSLPGTTSATTGLPFSVQIPQIQNLYNFLFDASWEIDLFGKTRRTIEAAQAEIGIVIEQKNGLLLSILAEVARNYVQLRSNQKQAELTELIIELLEKTAFIRQQSFQKGYINQIEYEQTEAQLASAKATLPPLIAASYKNIYAISVLTGEPPETLLPELLPPQPLPKLPPKLAVGLRSDLLRRRPDVRLAERELAQATANIGVAIASFFPTLTLYGDAGLQSLQWNKLFSWGSRTWAYGGGFNTPIFQGGKLFGNLHASQAAKTAAAENYEETVLQALQEAEQTLTAYNQDLKTLTFSAQVVEKNQKIVSITKEQHEKGLINLIRYFDRERELLATEQTLLNNTSTALTDLILLYKALGGGWEGQ